MRGVCLHAAAVALAFVQFAGEIEKEPCGGTGELSSVQPSSKDALLIADF